MMRILIFLAFFIGFNTILAESISCQGSRVPISGFAEKFASDKKIENAEIALYIYGEGNTAQAKVKTDKAGRFNFCVDSGQTITLTFSPPPSTSILKPHYISVQSETLVVPREGLNGIYDEITFQVPTRFTYETLRKIITDLRSTLIVKDSCVIVTTVSDYHKTMKDLPQGVENAKIRLNDSEVFSDKNKPYYFGITPFLNITNPFSSYRTQTSKDGGVLIYNLPASDKIQTLSAYKPGYVFSTVKFVCRDGAFINISPPRGPHCLHSTGC